MSCMDHQAITANSRMRSKDRRRRLAHCPHGRRGAAPVDCVPLPPLSLSHARVYPGWNPILVDEAARHRGAAQCRADIDFHWSQGTVQSYTSPSAGDIATLLPLTSTGSPKIALSK
jgi:hypothetical protein